MKQLLQKIKIAGAAALTCLIAILLFVLSGTVRARSRITDTKTDQGEQAHDKLATKAETKRVEAEDAIRGRSARSVAEQYEGVSDTIDAGRSRFASRVKTRVIAAGGRRVDEQHPE
ncbi:hypothetical protein K7J14_02530 [Treponema zuelzerae]|uniref:Uncharacterized protein n=1 Tax=Teretinema zuelzerae TaxID=156 RepID=A0AAE3EFC1_9SPIR|nr:hypothetical protein [Teretinema zuelzerae]MCD1653574.1 hypothetical protein [Teretinema zuelzerae]